MTYIISRLCIDCLDRGCVEVCPVECIYELVAEPSEALPNMLYIHPTECINCGACEPECPWGAIFEDLETPSELTADIELNAVSEEQPSLFQVANMRRDEHGRLVHKPSPSTDDVQENRRKWGLAD